MKKVILLVLCYILITSISSAQYYTAQIGTGNPNNINTEDFEYPYGGGLPSGWSVIHNGNTTNPQWSSTETLPFGFSFDGSPVSSYKVSTSGVLTFTTSASATPSSINNSLPHNSIPANSICVWGLSGKGTNDKIVQKTFGTAPNRQHWISFTAYSLPAIVNNHYTYWSIVLEETTNAIYIVDQRTSNNTPMALTLGIQLDGNSAVSVAGSPSISATAGDDPSRADNTYYTFLPGTQPNRDLKGKEVLLDDYLAASNGPFQIKLIVENLGSDTITQVDLNYLNSGNLKTTATITNLNILPWQTDTLTHPQTWAAQTGNTVFKAWAESLNGLNDQNTTNDTALKPIIILQNAAVRTTLLETFTSSTSVPSKNFNTNFENTTAQYNGNLVHVKYPMSWPGNGDPYFTTEGSSRRQFYGVSTLPNLQVDGIDWVSYNTILDAQALNTAQNKMALIELSAKYDYNGQTVCTEIIVEPLVSFNNPNLVLYAAIYEKESSQNTKNNGETVFYNIMKKMLPNADGTPLGALSSGSNNIQNFCYTFNGSYVLPPNANQPVNLGANHTVEEFSDLGVVAWLQDEVTKEVYQAAEGLLSIGIEESDLTHEIRVYPNPASSEFFIALHTQRSENIQISLINLTGQSVLSIAEHTSEGDQLIPVQLPTLPAGVYFVQVEMLDFTSTQKIIIH